MNTKPINPAAGPALCLLGNALKGMYEYNTI